MQFKKSVILGITAAAVAGTMVFAASHGGNPAVKARKAHMQLNAHNIGILGGMAKGDIEYNADAAQAAANNLLALSQLNQMSYWPPGTSNAELGDETRALPAAWEDMAGVIEDAQALTAAAEAMASNAGTLEGVQASIGALGGACGACHKAYRAPDS